MGHDLLTSLLAADELNATLTGTALRDAATDLLNYLDALNDQHRTRDTGRPGLVLWPVDAAGERLVGAAMILASAEVATFDHSRPFPGGAICVLVCGAVVGTVSLAEATSRAKSDGAAEVVAAVFHGFAKDVDGLAGRATLGARHAQVA